MNKKYYDALDDILDRPIAFNPSFKKITGSTNAGLLLSQAFYWTKRTSDPEGWFYKTRQDWMEETGLTAEELDGARDKCRKTGVLEEKLKGVPATLHYRVIKKKVYELLGFQFGGIPESGIPLNCQNGGKPESGSDPNFNKESENTSGIDNDNESVARAISQRTANLSKLYAENIGPITPLMADLIRNMAIDYPEESWYRPAFEVAVGNNARNLKYVDAVLMGWKDHYFGWKPEFKNGNGANEKGKNHANGKANNSTDPDQAARDAELGREILAQRAARAAARV